jgi:type IV pilus assembly protein PilB
MNSAFKEKIDLDSMPLALEVVRLIPEEICISNCIIPFKKEGGKICVATGSEIDSITVTEIKFLTGMEVVLYRGDREQIFSAVSNSFSKENAESAIKSLKSEYRNILSENEPDKNNSYQVHNSPIIKLTNSIIIRAICSEASDIHLEPFEEYVNVRFRIDGVLCEYIKLPKKIFPMVCTRIKVMSKLDITERRAPQDGKINFCYNNTNYDFRVSILPVVYGEKIVIRILYNEGDKIGLNKLGFDKDGIEFIKAMLNYSHGIILITGPTGSGKSTTLYSMLNSLNKSEKNIITIEDPVEYSLKGINQVNVCNKTGLSFAEGLRTILRQDPDVIMIGEIRDEETAKIAIRAAITGHLVLATLHTNDSSSSVLRLMDMGIPSYLVCDALIGIIAQRLIRKICPYCKEEYKPGEKTKSYKGRGCPKCNGTGYKGRTVIYEYNRIDNVKKGIIQNSKDIEELRRHNFESGMKNLQENCWPLVLKGITTLDEFNRITLFT